MIVKITVKTEKEGDSRVVYYNSGIPIGLFIKWRWYFTYLASRIKVKHPRWMIDIIMVPQELKLGEEYRQEKIKNLIKSCKAKISQLSNESVEADLFGMNEQLRQDRITKHRKRLADLESGVFDGYVPPEYINEIKRYI